MKRQQIQKKLARTAENIAAGITTGNFKEPVRSNNVAVAKGQPVTTLGYIFTKAGVVTPRGNVANGAYGLAKVLGVTPESLPVTVKAAVNNITSLETVAKYPSTIRARLPGLLKNLSTALKTAKIRKPYTKSGLYTAEARAAGTFGKSPAPSTSGF